MDAANPQAEKQMHVVYETLSELGASGKTVITLFNKQDDPGAERLVDHKADYCLRISARTGEGLEDLKELLSELLSQKMIYIERLVPYDKAGMIQLVRKQGQLLTEDYREDGIAITARIPMEIYTKIL